MANNMTDSELGVFREVWSQISIRGLPIVDGCAIGEDPEALVHRFLRANQYNATKTLQMLEDDIHWRTGNAISDLRIMKPEDILG